MARRHDGAELDRDLPGRLGQLHAAEWNAGCGTIGLCGTYADGTAPALPKSRSPSARAPATTGTARGFSSGAEVWNDATIGGGNWSYAFPAGSFPADGCYTVRVRARDAVANTQTPTSRTFTFDATAPSAAVDFPQAAEDYNAAGWDAGCATSGLCGTYSDATSGVADGRGLDPARHRQLLERHRLLERLRGLERRCHRRRRLGVRPSTPPTSPPTAATPSACARPTSPATRAAPRACTFTYDTTAPQTTIDSNPDDPTSSTDPPSPSRRTSPAPPSSAVATAAPGAPARARRTTPAWPTAATPSTCAPPTPPATPTPPPRSFTWVIDTTAPSSTAGFPVASGNYTVSRVGRRLRHRAASAAPTRTAPAPASPTVEVSIRQGTGDYWNGTGFSSASEVWNNATLAGGDWSYGFDAANFPADGNYTVRVRARDDAGNTETASSPELRLRRDRARDDHRLVQPDPSNSPNASFDFSSNEPGSTFECSIDGGTWTACTSPKSYLGLSDGSHSFDVRATDTAGNTDGNPATAFWNVDTTAPSSTASFPAPAAATRRRVERRLRHGRPLRHLRRRHRLRRRRRRDLHPPGHRRLLGRLRLLERAPRSGTTRRSPAATGRYALRRRRLPGRRQLHRARPRDRRRRQHRGRPRAGPSPIDTDRCRARPPPSPPPPAVQRRRLGRGLRRPPVSAAPTPTAPAPASPRSRSPSGSGTGNYWNGTGFSSATEVWNDATSPAATGRYAFDSSDFPADGSYTVRVRATDIAGNVEAPSSRTFTYDTHGTADDDRLRPDDPTSSTDPTFTFSANEPGSTFECRRDGGAWGALHQPEGLHQPGRRQPHLRRARHRRRRQHRLLAGVVHLGRSTPPRPARPRPSRSPPATTPPPSGMPAAPPAASAAPTATAPAPAWPRSRSPSGSGTGNYWNGTGFSSATEVWNNADHRRRRLGVRLRLPPTSRPTAATRCACAPATQPATRRRLPRARSTSTRPSPRRASTRRSPIRATRPTRASTSPRTSPARPSSAASTAAPGRLHEPRELPRPRRRQPQLRRARHRHRGQHRRQPGHDLLERRHDRPLEHRELPAAGGSYTTAEWNAGCATSGLCGTYDDGSGSGVVDVEISIRQGIGDYWDGSDFSSATEVWNDATLAGGDWELRLRRRFLPGRRQLHRARPRHRRRGQHAVALDADVRLRLDSAELHRRLPRRLRALQRLRLERGLRRPRPLRHLRRRPRHRRRRGRGLHPPRHRQLLERHRLRERHRGLERRRPSPPATGTTPSIPPSFPADGNYTVRVRATDVAGNVEAPRAGRSRTTPRPADDDRLVARRPGRHRRRRLRLLLERGRLDLRVPHRRRRLERLHQPEELHEPHRRQPHLRGARHRRAGNTDSSPASFTWLVDTTAPSSSHELPRLGRRVQRRRLGRRLRHRRPLRHLRRRLRLRRGRGRGLHPPRHRQLLERHRLLERDRGLERRLPRGRNWSYAFDASDFPADGSYTVRVRATDDGRQRARPRRAAPS